MRTSLSQRLREGIAAAQAKQFDRARPILEQVAEETPNDVLAWFWLGAASPSADAAIPCLRRVLAIDPGHAHAREALAKLLVSHAMTVASAGNRPQARALVAEATELNPDAEGAWLALVALSEDYDERIAALRHAIAVNPQQPQTRTRLRQALLSRAMMVASMDRPRARTLLAEAAEIEPRDWRVWQWLAQMADTTGEAVDAWRIVVRIAPEHGPGRIQLEQALVAEAQALAAAGSMAEACARWREATVLDDRDIDAWLGLADATDDDEEAQRAVDAAAAIDPTDSRVTAALTRLRDEPLDPVAFEPPADAFAHLEQPLEILAELDDAADQPIPEPDILFAPTALAAPRALDLAVVSPAEPVALPAPMPAEAAVVAPMKTAPPASAGERGDSSRRTVMVVDDSPTIRKILGLTLERAGYKVVAEPDGESAVERLHHIVPDLILLDIAMPKLDGYEVCKRIKSDPRTSHVPVVMLSGKDAFFDKVKGHMAGAAEYLTKPFETQAMLAVVSSHCPSCEEVAHG